VTAVVEVPLTAGRVHCTAAGDGGLPGVVLRPAVEQLGLDYNAQLQRLRRSSWARVCMTHTLDAVGRRQEMATVDPRTFLMLMATVAETRVREEVRPVLRAFQSEAADAIERHFSPETAAPAPRRELSRLELIDMARSAELQRIESEHAREEAEEARQLAETKVAELEPSAAAWEVIGADGHDYKVEDVAKVLQREHNVDTGPRRLMQALVRMGWIYRAPDGRPRPYQSTITCGRMTQQLKTYEDRKTGEIIHYWLVKVTAKGIADLLKRRGEIEAEQQATH